LSRDQSQQSKSIEAQLIACQQAEEDYARFFSQSLDLLCIAGFDGYFKQVNPAFENTLGIKNEELLAEPFLSFVYPDDREATLAEMAKLTTGTETIAFENRYRCQNGSYRWLLWNATPYIDEKIIYATARDITERKKFEQDLQESQERYSLAIQGSRDGLWDWNLLTNEVYYSPRFKEILGYKDWEMENLFSSFESRLHPDDLDMVLDRIQAHLKKQISYNVEYRLRAKSGDYRWIYAKGQAIWDEAGIPTRMAGSICDVTERKQAEQTIIEQAALLDVATNAIFVQGLNCQILYWNRGAEELYGWTAEEVLSRDVRELLYEESLPQFEKILETFLKLGQWQGELHHFNKVGKALTLESRWTLVYNQLNAPKSILVVNTDITEKKEIEMQFLRFQRIESIGTLANGIAHDLNNILTPMLAIAQLLPIKLPNVDDQTKNLFEILETSAKRGSALVSQVLSFSRGIEGQRVEVQVGHLIQEIKKIAHQTFPKSIQVQTEISSDLWTVFGDATQLHQVLMNISVNARDAMPKGGKIQFFAENLVIDESYAQLHIESSVGPHILITIADTGVGIPSEIVDKIFEPFFTTKEVGSGSGLGLSTVRGIIKSHGGFIKVYSERGKGTQFKIYLPATGTESELAVSKKNVFLGQGELILVVDDEEQIREITKTVLESFNYQVITACDGIEAIINYSQHKDSIGAVLMDMMMPSMDGETAILALEKINPQVKIIVNSGLVSNHKNPLAISPCVEALLLKPYSTDELLKTLQKVFHNSEGF
jgi:PAS domain S-box-containing protein